MIFKKIIPFWRELISQSGIDKDHIINSNSSIKPDIGELLENKNQIVQRKDQNIIFFDFMSDEISMTYNEDGKTKNNYKMVLILNIYGSDSDSLAVKINNLILSRKLFEELKKNNIGINKNIRTKSFYETISNQQYFRTIMEIPFIYEQIDNIIKEDIIEKTEEIKIMGE